MEEPREEEQQEEQRQTFRQLLLENFILLSHTRVIRAILSFISFLMHLRPHGNVREMLEPGYDFLRNKLQRLARILLLIWNQLKQIVIIIIGAIVTFPWRNVFTFLKNHFKAVRVVVTVLLIWLLWIFGVRKWLLNEFPFSYWDIAFIAFLSYFVYWLQEGFQRRWKTHKWGDKLKKLKKKWIAKLESFLINATFSFLITIWLFQMGLKKIFPLEMFVFCWGLATYALIRFVNRMKDVKKSVEEEKEEKRKKEEQKEQERKEEETMRRLALLIQALAEANRANADSSEEDE